MRPAWIFCALFSIASTANAASFTYSYSGLPFGHPSRLQDPELPYLATDRITGQLTFEASNPNVAFDYRTSSLGSSPTHPGSPIYDLQSTRGDVTNVRFTMSDGERTFDTSTYPWFGVKFATGAGGQPADWVITFSSPAPDAQNVRISTIVSRGGAFFGDIVGESVSTVLSEQTSDFHARVQYGLANYNPWSFASSAPGSSESNPILPDNATPPFQFNFNASQANQITWFDPVIAVGYEYEVLEGPGITKFQLPSSATVPQVGPYLLTIYSGDQIVHNEHVMPGQTYNFGGNGWHRFRITGINPSVAIDPANPLAFPTGLAFASTDPVRFSMKPLTIPEPHATLLAAIAAVSIMRWRGEGLRDAHFSGSAPRLINPKIELCKRRSNVRPRLTSPRK